jgi:phosphohistidine phosphatase
MAALRMTHLYVLRHAKSSWEDPRVVDHDRPLSPRGRQATKLLAEHLRPAHIAPDLVLCSSARRARETLDGIAPALAEGVAVEIEPDLYEATEADLLERLRRIPDTVDSAMLIGHNPAVHMLTLILAGAGEELPSVKRKYPTGALATLAFEGPWSELEPQTAELVRFARPKDLG